ncbi:MAG: SsrA-binding protein SmpB [Phascolarctobacterium sp.]|nr:SsrA-binding protein SmpB [Phascolarctobacterium sp.]
MEKTIKVIAENRKARHDYQLLESWEAGIALTGTEVKALRQGKANLRDAYAQVTKQGEIIVYQLHISEYEHGNINNHDPLRSRRLLLHKQEIKKITNKVMQKGFTLVPVKLYFKHGFVKVELALAQGKQNYDKRQTLVQRDVEREMDRERKRRM